MLWSEEWARRHGPTAVDPHESIERGGDLPEGAHSPRARRSLARGGVPPSSEAELHLRGRPALERGRILPEGASSPRARWSFGGTAPCPSSEAEFRTRGVGADRLMVRLGVPGPWAPVTRP
jgi:hypothetical protein